MSDRRQLARLAAPAAFLLAVTILVLLVRSAMSADEPTATPAPTVTAPAETATAPVTTEETETGAEEAEPPPATTQAGNTYTIRAGDTFETIAEQHGTTVEELVELNPDVDPTALQIGQAIRIP